MLFGLEIEHNFLFPDETERCLNEANVAASELEIEPEDITYGRGPDGVWHVKTESTTEDGAELNSPILDSQDERSYDAIADVCAVMSSVNGLELGDNVGTHMHIDVASLSPMQRMTFYDCYSRFLPSIAQVIGVARTRKQVGNESWRILDNPAMRLVESRLVPVVEGVDDDGFMMPTWWELTFEHQYHNGGRRARNALLDEVFAHLNSAFVNAGLDGIPRCREERHCLGPPQLRFGDVSTSKFLRLGTFEIRGMYATYDPHMLWSYIQMIAAIYHNLDHFKDYTFNGWPGDPWNLQDFLDLLGNPVDRTDLFSPTSPSERHTRDVIMEHVARDRSWLRDHRIYNPRFCESCRQSYEAIRQHDPDWYSSRAMA